MNNQVENDESFEVNGSTEQMVSNILEQGRYPFEVKEATNYTSKSGNKCIKVEIDVNGKKMTDYLSIEGKMEWKWRQFLFAIGIRDKRTSFSVPKSKIIGVTGLVDIGTKDRTMEDGTIIRENITRSYSPIEEATAPITGVPPEVEIVEKQDKPKEKEEEI